MTRDELVTLELSVLLRNLEKRRYGNEDAVETLDWIETAMNSLCRGLNGTPEAIVARLGVLAIDKGWCHQGEDRAGDLLADLVEFSGIPAADLPWLLYPAQSIGDLLTLVFAQKRIYRGHRYRLGDQVWRRHSEGLWRVEDHDGHDGYGEPRYLLRRSCDKCESTHESHAAESELQPYEQQAFDR